MRLRELREELGLTQREVAERMGVTEQRVGVIEKNDLGNLKLHTVERFVAACGGWMRLEAQFGGEVDWTVRLLASSAGDVAAPAHRGRGLRRGDVSTPGWPNPSR